MQCGLAQYSQNIFEQDLQTFSQLACKEPIESRQSILTYDFDEKFQESDQNVTIKHHESMEIRCKCANQNICRYNEPKDFNITMMLFIQETRFGSPEYYHKYSSYYFSYKPMIGQFHSRISLSMRATIKNFTDNIWGFNKQFKQDNMTFVQYRLDNMVSSANKTNPMIWRNPFFAFEFHNNLRNDEIEVYTIVPKTMLDGLVQIGALVGLYGLVFKLLIIINRYFTNKKKLKYFEKYQDQVRDSRYCFN
eukprot:403342591